MMIFLTIFSFKKITNIDHVDGKGDLENKGDLKVMECKKHFLRKQKQRLLLSFPPPPLSLSFM